MSLLRLGEIWRILSGMIRDVAHITTTDVARVAHVDDSTVRRWVKRGELRAAIVTPGGHYRFDPLDVDRLLARRKTDERAAS